MNEQELRTACLQMAINSPVGSGDVLGDAKRFLEFIKGQSVAPTNEANAAKGFNALAGTKDAAPPPKRKYVKREPAVPAAPEVPGPNAYTIDQFMAAYGIRRNLVYDEINSGRLSVRKVGSRTLIPRSDADAWLASLPTKHGAD